MELQILWKNKTIDEVINQEINQEVRQIEKNIICLNDISRDLALLVDFQGEQIGQIDIYTSEVVFATNEGLLQLEQAEVHSNMARRKVLLLKGAIVFSSLTVGGLGLTIISPIVGIITVGAVITGIVTTIGIALKKE